MQSIAGPVIVQEMAVAALTLDARGECSRVLAAGYWRLLLEFRYHV